MIIAFDSNFWNIEFYIMERLKDNQPDSDRFWINLMRVPYYF